MGEVTSCAALFEVRGGGMQMQNRLFCISVPICCGTEMYSGLFCTCVPRLISWNHWNFAVSLKAGCVVPWDASADSAVLHVRPDLLWDGSAFRPVLHVRPASYLVESLEFRRFSKSEVGGPAGRKCRFGHFACASRICLVFAPYHHGAETCFGELRHLCVPASGSCTPLAMAPPRKTNGGSSMHIPRKAAHAA